MVKGSQEYGPKVIGFFSLYTIYSDTQKLLMFYYFYKDEGTIIGWKYVVFSGVHFLVIYFVNQFLYECTGILSVG